MHALGPKASHCHGNLRSFATQVRVVARVFRVVAKRQDHRAVAVDFFEGDFPFIAAAFLAVHGDHGAQRSSVSEAQLLRIFDGLAQLVVAVTQQLLRHVRRVRGQEKRQTIRLGVPIGGAAVFPRETLGPDVQTSVVSRGTFG